MLVSILVASLIGALAFRIRGGWQPFDLSIGGTTANRIAWSGVMAALAAVIAWDWRLIALAPAFFAGVAPGWGSYADLGRVSKLDNEFLAPVLRLTGLRDGSFWYDFAGLALRGLVLTAPAGLVLGWLTGVWWFAAVGAAMPAAYFIGWKIKGTETAEFIFGGLLGATIVAAVL